MNTQYTSSMRHRLSKSRKQAVLHFTVALIVLGAVSEGVNASAGSSKGFCAPQVIRDYLAPLDRVPLASKFSPSGQIGVGPASLRIFVNKGRLVPSGRGGFGAQGSVVSQKDRSQVLNWEIASQLEKIANPKFPEVIRRKHQPVLRVSNFNGRQFGFSSNGIPTGLYRLTVEIRNAAGRVLAKYQEAFRTMRPRTDLRLAKSFKSLALGESGLIRIDNYGTVEATFGANYQLWSASGAEVPINPIFGNVLYSLSAGMAGPCITFTVPPNLPPGEYRIGSMAGDLIQRNQLLTTVFSVSE